MTLTLSNFDSALKENYSADIVTDLVTQRHPLFALMPKDTGWTGDVKIVPLQYGNPQSIGSGTGNFSTIQSNIGQSKYDRWTVTSSQHYGLIQVNREAFLASADSDGAFADALDREVRSVLKEVGRDLARQLFGTSDNYLAQNTSGTASPITVGSQNARKFEIGMRIKASSNSDGSSPRSGVGVVTAVDYDAGTVTYSGTITSLGATDYIFREGAIASSTGTGVVGLEQWLGSSSALFGVTRTASSRLQGQALDASGLSIEDACIKAIIDADREGGYIDVIIMDHDSYRKLQSSQQSDKRYPVPEGDVAKLGFKEVQMVNGAMVIPDRFCPANTAYALELESWSFCSRGDLVHFVEDDGRILLRNASSDSVDARVASYCQLVCDAPIHNVRITNLGL